MYFSHFKVGDLDIYSIGQGPKCIIWNYDIFGFDSGRSRQMCDLVADAGIKILFKRFNFSFLNYYIYSYQNY